MIGNHLAVAGSELAPSPVWGFTLFRYGWTGVDLFFVLSGFLIGRQLQRELQRTGAGRRPAVPPPPWAADLAALLRRGWRSSRSRSGKWRGIWPDLVFLSNYVQGQVSGGWSLSTEEQFYLLVPLLLLAVQRLFGPRGQAWVPIVLLALMPVVRAVVLQGRGEAGFDRIYGPIHTHCDGLLVGLFLAWLSVARPAALVGRAATSVALAAGGDRRWLRPAGDRSTAVQLHRARAHLRRPGHARAPGGTAGARSLTAWRGFHVLSRLSFGMYLNHFEVLPRILPRLTRALVPVVGTGWVLAAVVFLIAVLSSALVASITFVLIEEPFLALRERWEARHRAGEALEPVLRRVS